MVGCPDGYAPKTRKGKQTGDIHVTKNLASARHTLKVETLGDIAASGQKLGIQTDMSMPVFTKYFTPCNGLPHVDLLLACLCCAPSFHCRLEQEPNTQKPYEPCLDSIRRLGIRPPDLQRGTGLIEGHKCFH